MNRREIIAAFGGASVAWPLMSRAQQQATPVIGVLGITSPEQDEPASWAAFREGLRETGYVEGQNVIFAYRLAEGYNDRLPALAGELVARKIDVIVTGGMPATRAAMKATGTIPILFAIGADPVATGFVSNLARPDGNVTGTTGFGPRLVVKRFELLMQLDPRVRLVGYLVDAHNPASAKNMEQVQQNTGLPEAAREKGVEVRLLSASDVQGIDTAFATLAELKPAGLLLATEAVFSRYRQEIVNLADRYRIPAIYFRRNFAASGGLISYGNKEGEHWRTMGVYAGRILAGAKPADLPVQMPTHYELAINRKTANALGLTVPLMLETQADEIVE
jgi:putative ABC transport system substrate-binding protein